MKKSAALVQAPEVENTSAPCAIVRPYRTADREAVRRICCDTGFLGRPVDTLFHDRELFADLMTSPYLNGEPEWAWVAESGGEVVGYLLASVSPHFARRQILTGAAVTMRMLYRLATGRYARHPRSRRYVRWLITRAGRERPRHPRGAAHLHFNLLKGFRGRLGFKLWNQLLRRLREAGIENLYGEFFSYPGHHPEEIYARYGFVPFDRRKTTLFREEFADPVHIVVCVKGPVSDRP